MTIHFSQNEQSDADLRSKADMGITISEQQGGAKAATDDPWPFPWLPFGLAY